MLEKMGDFFEARLKGYDEHMLGNIESARVFYPFTARCLPMAQGARILDLGCGTGLELEEYFAINPSARVTGNEFYHYDTPLTVPHETEALTAAGFSSVEVLDHWGATFTLKAVR